MKKHSKQSKSKNGTLPYWQMNLEQLREATREFDREFVPTQPLTPAMRAQWARAKRKRGRPVTGKGAKTIALTVERGLLERADALAEREGITRANLVARGLKAVLAAYAEPSAVES